MNLHQLSIQIYTELINQFLYYEISNNPQLIYSIAIEIIARLFVLSLQDIEKDKPMFDNIHNKHKICCEDNGKYFNASKTGDVYESELKTLRRFEKKLRQGHETNLKYYDIENTYSVEKDINLRRRGRTYDSANLELIFSTINNSPRKLLLYLIKNMLTDSNKVSDTNFVEAYDAFDDEYESAKKCNDKMQYIIKWIDFCRMETKCHFSLIPQIADYMSKHKNMPLNSIVNFWGTGYIKKGVPIEAYQILRYEGYIRYFEESCSEEMAQEVLNERIVSSIVCSKYREKANETFRPFYEGSVSAIDEMYVFCHDIFPVIELHNSSGFYLSDGKINRPKIKCARKIIDSLLCPNVLNRFYKENTD